MVMCLSYPPLPRDMVNLRPAAGHWVSTTGYRRDRLDALRDPVCSGDLTDAELAGRPGRQQLMQG